MRQIKNLLDEMHQYVQAFNRNNQVLKDNWQDKKSEHFSDTCITIVNNKGVPSINPSYKAYLQSVSAYQGIIKTLNTIFGKQIEDEEDEFESFMAKNGKS